jgi:hypothetical protein
MSITSNVSHNEDGSPKVLGQVKRKSSSLKFPDDPISAGNFWTKISVNSWAPHAVAGSGPAGQAFELNQHHLADLWLPMPLTLATGYNQNFTDSEDVMVNRGMSASGADAGFVETVKDGTTSTVWGLAQEISKAASGMMAMNVSAKMAKGSVANQNMGLSYDGATLRAHTFSWRMTPKNNKEQLAIARIVMALKGYTSPVTKGATGGDPNKESTGVLKTMTDAAEGFANEHANVGGNKTSVLRSIGRLAIPPTVDIEFWYKDKINPNLFKVKSSFITNLEVNYTPTGTWNAYMDGAPVETQITLSTKETSIVTADEVVGGY